jgi:hypothetical protein
MIYTIEKGSHRSTWLPKVTLSNKIFISFSFETDPSYILDNKSDQEDTNKIFGISDSWYHRKHSVRLGWRYDNKLQKSICSVYYYVDGKHYIEDLGEIEQFETSFFYLKILNDRYEVIALDKKITIPRTSRWFGPRYLLFPYFGGQQVAPKQFKIKINKW